MTVDNKSVIKKTKKKLFSNPFQDLCNFFFFEVAIKAKLNPIIPDWPEKRNKKSTEAG